MPLKPNQEKNAEHRQRFHHGHVHHVLLHGHIRLPDLLWWGNICIYELQNINEFIHTELCLYVCVCVCVCVCACTENTEAELLHTYSKVDPLDTLILCVRLAVLVAVTLTVPVVLFPVRTCLHIHSLTLTSYTYIVNFQMTPGLLPTARAPSL